MAKSFDEPTTFEEALGQLEQIVHDLEDGSIGLEESLSRYEQGVSLLKRCYGQLRDAEQKILLLTGVDEEGQPTLQPFQPSLPAEPARPENKKTRKKTDEPRSTSY